MIEVARPKRTHPRRDLRAGDVRALSLEARSFDATVVISEVPLILRYDQTLGASKMKVARTIADTLKLVARRRLGVD